MTSPGSISRDGSAFRLLGEAISSFQDVFDRLAMPPHDVDRAEGERLFWRYFTIGLDQFVEFADPAHPAFHSKTRDGVRKFSGDAPGQLYDSAVISAEHSYVVTGNMAETAMIELGIYSGDLSGRNATRRRLIDALTEEEFDIAEDGSFAIHLTAPVAGETPKNTLRLEPDAGSLMIRRYLRDPRVDRPRPLRIERISSAPPMEPLRPERLQAGLDRAVAFATHNVELWSKWADNIKATKRNVLVGFDDTGELYTPKGHHYLDGYWDLGEDEALTIAFRPPAGCYWSFVPMNYWLESLEWRFEHTVHATSFDTPVGPDGYVRLVLAERDPGLADHRWLETLGHREGLMALRLARNPGAMPVAESAIRAV